MPFYDLVLEVTHCCFCHILFTRNESLSLAHVHAEVNQVPAADGRRLREFLDAHENPLIGHIARMVCSSLFSLHLLHYRQTILYVLAYSFNCRVLFHCLFNHLFLIDTI